MEVVSENDVFTRLQKTIKKNNRKPTKYYKKRTPIFHKTSYEVPANKCII
jgi:hypothetical protein